MLKMFTHVASKGIKFINQNVFCVFDEKSHLCPKLRMAPIFIILNVFVLQVSMSYFNTNCKLWLNVKKLSTIIYNQVKEMMTIKINNLI